MRGRVGLSIVRALLLAALLAPALTLAADGRGRGHENDSAWVPELDPAAVGAVAALVAGGGVLLARRRGGR